jgi:hypothetical protein
MTLGQILFELHATQVENCKFILSQGNYSKILNKSTQKYPGAQLHMLINIPIKFHDSRSITLLFTRDTKREGWTEVRTDKGVMPLQGGSEMSDRICHGLNIALM